MTSGTTSTPPSQEAMTRFIAQAPGLRRPHIVKKSASLPTLPDLKRTARERREAGHEVVDQSAGDIDDVGQPLSPKFVDWINQARDQLITEGYGNFARTKSDAYGFPGAYIQQYPVVRDALARSWGMNSIPYHAIQTISGRTLLDFAMRGLMARAEQAGKTGKYALIVEALAWSGYQPLAAELGLTLVQSPALPEHGLSASAEGLKAAVEFAQAQGLTPIGSLVILPSNPTGAGIERQELQRYIEAAAEADVPVVIDAFYSPLAPEGHDQAVPMAWLEKSVAPEALAYLGLVVGETKVTSSQNKTGTLFWYAPNGHDSNAGVIVKKAMRRMSTTNAYPRPNEALVAYALHTFPDGVKAAMGPRYEALHECRLSMRRICDELNLPLSIGGSFYGTAALVNDSGETLVRDTDGRPMLDARDVASTLIIRFGLVGAPGAMFAQAPEAAAMIRLTAAVSVDEMDRVRQILTQLVEEGAG